MRFRVVIYVLAAVAVVLGLALLMVSFQPGSPLSTPVPSLTSTGSPTTTRPSAPTPTFVVTATLTLTPSRPSTPTPTSAFVSVADLVRIPAGEIHDLWVSGQGELWIAAANGLFRQGAGDSYQRLSDLTFSRILGSDDLGRVWAVGLDGAAVLSYGGGRWRSYGIQQGWARVDPGLVQRRLAVDARGHLWLATGSDDLRHYDPGDDSWESLRAVDLEFLPADPSYQGHYLTTAAIAPGGSVWVGDCIGMGEGFEGQGVRYLQVDDWEPLPETAGECVFDIARDGRGRMWVGGFDRLLRYDPATGSWTHLPLPPWDRRQIVTSISLDPAGNPWIGLLRCGPAACDALVHYFLDGGAWRPFLDETTQYEIAPGLAFGAGGVAWICNRGDVYRRDGGGLARVGALRTGACLVAVDGSQAVWVGASLGQDAGLWLARR